MLMITTQPAEYVIIATVAGDEEWCGRSPVQDGSGEVFSFRSFEDAVLEADCLTAECRSRNVSYSVEAA